MNRKRRLVAQLGPLERFMEMSGMVDDMEKALRDTRAKGIYRRGVID